jgi:hypothetical protein
METAKAGSAYRSRPAPFLSRFLRSDETRLNFDNE